MTPLEIKIELMRAGTAQAEIARQCKRSRTHIWRVISEPCKGREFIRQAIAEAIDRTPEEVWPDFYRCKADKECA